MILPMNIEFCSIFGFIDLFVFFFSFLFMQAVQFLLASRERLSTGKSDDLSVKDGRSGDKKETEPQQVDPIQVSWFLI